ncbi:MAG: phytanoyl-CoA dioxygenase [Proteobacteria bacterium]|nr:MAG: phytanoyl-CoA dioxygenase [Pseudomonadota bacterium]
MESDQTHAFYTHSMLYCPFVQLSKSTMKKALKLPLWILQLFTTAKSFRDNPVLGSPILNKLGLHVIRVVVANGVMTARMWLLGFGVDAADRKSYRENGFIHKENFVPEPLFSQIEAEIRAFKGDVRQCHQGDTQNHRTLLDPETLQHLPHTRTLLESPEFQRLLRYTAGHTRMPFFHIENIHNGVTKAKTDPQKNFHTDTFHPSMKFWLFLDNVDEHNGSFTYVPGSHKLTRQRLAWEYRKSQQAQQDSDSYTARGSFRFNAQDFQSLQLAPPKAFKANKNTLVIANTFGVHGRGEADPGSTRLGIWGMSRTNPFLPFPGTGLKLFDRLQYDVFNWIRHLEDQRAAKRGAKAAWHRVD